MSDTPKKKNTNVTVNLAPDEQEALDYLVDYFQKHSISAVTKSDVIKYMLKRFKFIVEEDRLEEMLEERE